MKVYLSASWKQRERVRKLALMLRAEGHEVYDFTDSACRSAILGRPCEEIPPERFPVPFDPAVHRYATYMTSGPHWREAVAGNMAALRWCELVVLLLPAGCDAHADWALGVGLGRPSAVVGHPPVGERTPSHLWADALLDRDEDILGWVDAWQVERERAGLPGSLAEKMERKLVFRTDLSPTKIGGMP